jgi:hypothetical protein
MLQPIYPIFSFEEVLIFPLDPPSTDLWIIIIIIIITFIIIVFCRKEFKFYSATLYLSDIYSRFHTVSIFVFFANKNNSYRIYSYVHGLFPYQISRAYLHLFINWCDQTKSCIYISCSLYTAYFLQLFNKLCKLFEYTIIHNFRILYYLALMSFPLQNFVRS